MGAWVSTRTDGSSQTMDIEQWGAGEYFVVVNDENAACPGGAQVTGTGRPTTDSSLIIPRSNAYCWDAQGWSPPEVGDAEAITSLDLAATGELVDSFGVVWRRQVVPLTDAEDTALLEAFLGARVAGEGAERYLLGDPPSFEATTVPPLLYATSSGSTYERFEIERVPERDAQPGWTRVEVRLFAEDGTVVAQRFHVVDQDGRHGLVYGYAGDVLTTENWQSVPVAFGILDGEVTFAAAPPWREDYESSRTIAAFQKSAWNISWFVVAAEPLATGTACEKGPTPTDAESLVRSIMAGPDIEVGRPEPVMIGGLAGLRIDVPMSDGINALCAWTPDALAPFQGGGAIRFFIVDYPGESASVLTFAFVAGPDEWGPLDDIVGILDSIEFHVD